ncbi:MAG: cupin domain-containing protein [Anaerolineae bacterium]|nr:cupin domain-containing protein [Anaerolineae bacterium]NIN98294.1 cupin domain-containing protein [Anaerolineae bacterium]NIQ81223.1 cupin domain-containing protein [Anaerolineae bacterium]
MGSLHRFTGEKGDFEWEDVEAEAYDSPGVRAVSVRWLIGPQEGAGHFAMRYFEIEPGGETPLDSHEHDHGVMVLRGKGRVLVGDDSVDVSFGDMIYVSPREEHRFKCLGQEPFGFLCVIPSKRDTHE